MLEYRSPVWLSAAASHLSLLDRGMSKAVRSGDVLVVCSLKHRRRIAAIIMFHKIYSDTNPFLEVVLPQVHVPARLTRLAVSVHSRYLDVPKCRTLQFSLSFVPAYVQLLNFMDESCIAGDGVAGFKSQINRALLFS